MAVSALQKFISNKRNLLVLTGAGISTESGIPDYRSPGRPLYAPMQHGMFMESAASRKRYWSRSMVGYPRMLTARPNSGHRALAKAEREGLIRHVITQNVDGLHHLAGSKHVLELHGSIRMVACVSCGKEVPRSDLQNQLSALNPKFAEMAVLHASSQFPDGDMEVEDSDLSAFMVPDCPDCRGILKPAIVFFGANLPREVSQRSTDLTLGCDGLLVVGTSLAVQSANRLIAIALLHPPFVADRSPAEIFIINDGPTRADPLLLKQPTHVQKTNGRAGELLCATFGSQFERDGDPSHATDQSPEINSGWLP